MDHIDQKILKALQENGRLTNLELAEKVSLSPSPCFRRVRRLENEGLIKGYKAVLDRQAMALRLTCFVEIKVEKHSLENAAELQRTLERMPEVISCYMISGEADFLAEIVVPDLEAYEELLTHKLLTLPMVKDIRSNFALRQIKSDGALPVGHLT